MATAMSSVSCISGAKLFSAAAAPQATRRSGVQRINAAAPKQTQPEVTAPNPEVVPPNVLEYAKKMPGVTAPFPNIFDPADLLARAASSPRPIKELNRWRESEITHGRVAMLASLGFIVQEQLQDYSLFYNFDGKITGPAIYHFQQVEARGAVFWEPLLFAIALCEAYRVGLGWATPRSEDFNTLRDDYEPGNLGFDPLGLLPTDPQERKDMQSKELNNGRLAMIAIAAFVAQELVSGEEIFVHLFKRLGL
jgi:light-harvesting complex I chlorophyll a/b binding protein 1